MESKLLAEGRGVDVGSLFSDLVRLEIELWDAVDRRLRDVHELPLSWFEPMQVIERTSGCRVLDIAEALAITIGGTSKLVDRIEAAGWIERSRHPDDGRSSLIRLTRPGRRLLAAARGTFRAELDGLVGAALAAGQLELLAAALQGMLGHVRTRTGRTHDDC